jgi:50S ribosomal subunit-associated GTPase HflX
MAQRSAAEIRNSIESNRAELAVSLNRLHGEVTRITDWRGQLERHQREVAIGVVAVGVLLLGRRRRKRKRLG